MKPLAFFRSLDSREKVIVLIVILVVILIAKNAISAYLKAKTQQVKNTTELAGLAAAGQKANYSEDEYESMANAMYYSMAGVGTDERGVYTVIGKLKNDVDFIKLDQTFGIKDGYDLRGWLRDDMSGDEVVLINTILQKKGISKRI